MAFTFVAGRRLAVRPSKPLLAFSIVVVLGVLGYFKYAGFLLATSLPRPGATTSWRT